MTRGIVLGSLLLAAHLLVGCDSKPVAGSAPPEAFDRVQFTPQQVDFSALAAAYGWGHVRVTTRGELDEALTGRIDGPQLVEVPLDR